MSADQMASLVDSVVRRVKAQMESGGAAGQGLEVQQGNGAARQGPAAASGERLGVYPDMEQAIEAAQSGFGVLQRCSLADRQAMVVAMRNAAVREAERLGRFVAEETGLGRASHKTQKILLAARKTPGTEDLVPTAYTGDDGLSLVEPAPYGLIGAITPSTNPASTIINNSISILAAGNAVVFNPHPSAKRVSQETMRVLSRAILEAGGPADVICAPAEPTMETGALLMKHPKVKLLVVTGGGVVTQLAMTSGKKTVAAGPGNPPVIVDDTASLSHAARSIVDGASFDNNVLCIAEKEIFVYGNVADRLKEEMRRVGAFEVTGRDRDRLVERCLDLTKPEHPVAARDCVGKEALRLLDLVGLKGPADTRLVMCEVEDLHHPLIQAEQLMPFIPILRVDGLDEALACAKQAEHGFRHTAMMHSENVFSMSRVAKEIETTIFVKNAPSYAGLGLGGEGFTTLSIAGPTGEGLTSARTFTRQRRCVLAGAFRIV
ncbi:MAG: aldehyde dehydrogenase EutE [Polyangia bacterium]|nr:aldehyde dehydrogenase EutE [Polyangia bacterium]